VLLSLNIFYKRFIVQTKLPERYPGSIDSLVIISKINIAKDKPAIFKTFLSKESMFSIRPLK